MTRRQRFIFPIRSLFHYLVMAVWLSVGILVGLFHKAAGTGIVLSWVRFFLKLYGIHVRVQNDNTTETPTGCVFALLNQSSLLDGPVGITVIPKPCRGIVNLEYALIPFFGWAMWICCWVIVRQWPSQAKKTLANVDRFLQNGGNLWMSIEGRRSKNGYLSAFKKGPVVIAIRANARIVPVIISGTREVLGYGRWRIRSGNVVVRFLKAIPTTGLRYDDRDTVIQQLVDLAEQEIPAVA